MSRLFLCVFVALNMAAISYGQNSYEIQYNFSGQLEDAGLDPWNVGGDGSIRTQDGTDYDVTFAIRSDAVETNTNANAARFLLSEVDLRIGGVTAQTTSSSAFFWEPFPSLDVIDVSTVVLFNDVSQSIFFRAAVDASTFSLDPGFTLDPPPVFSATPQIGANGHGTSAHSTISVQIPGRPVSVSVPEPGATSLWIAGCLLAVLRRSRS